MKNMNILRITVMIKSTLHPQVKLLNYYALRNEYTIYKYLLNTITLN